MLRVGYRMPSLQGARPWGGAHAASSIAGSRPMYTTSYSKSTSISAWSQKVKGSFGRSRGIVSPHWTGIGAVVALCLFDTRQAECENAVFSNPIVTSSTSPIISDSLISRLKEKMLNFFNFLRTKIKKLWRMLIRTGTILSIYLPVFSTLPIAMAFQYERFVKADESVDFWWWRALRLAIRTSGPCMIKMAQWIATRPDLFPFCMCRNLQELQIEASPPKINWKDTEDTITDALGPDWKSLYKIDEAKVLGSGCVAQVHLGQVIATNQPIAVKVIHKNVAENIAIDMEIMGYLSSWLEVLPGVHNLSMSEIVEEFRILMISQLDLRKEAEALKRFRHNFGCDYNERATGPFGFGYKRYITNKVAVTFPLPLEGLAFKNVLFETFEEGEVISKYLDPRVRFPVESHPTKRAVSTNIENVDASTLHALATAGVDVMLKMIFEDNFIHADLHSGNIIVKNMRTSAQENAHSSTKREGEGLCVSMVDAGLTAELNDEDRRNFLDLFAALVRNDGRQIGRLMIERNSKNNLTGQPLTQKQFELFQERMHEVVSQVHESGLALGRISIGDLLQKVLLACYENNVKLDSKFVSIMLALGVMEGMGRRLDPDVDLLKAAAPQVLKASAKFAAYYAAKTLREAQRQHASRHPSRALATETTNL